MERCFFNGGCLLRTRVGDGMGTESSSFPQPEYLGLNRWMFSPETGRGPYVLTRAILSSVMSSVLSGRGGGGASGFASRCGNVEVFSVRTPFHKSDGRSCRVCRCCTLGHAADVCG